MNLIPIPSLRVGWVILAFTSLPLHVDAATTEEKKATTTKKEVAKKPQLSSFYRSSHILVSRGKHTVIPKGSIIHLPAKDKAKISEKPSGKFVFWPDFIKKNQNWIWTYEITENQAKGLQPIPESKLEEFAKLNRMVVATYQKSPINILPPPPKPENPSEKQPKKN